jgi:hypothetical protein
MSNHVRTVIFVTNLKNVCHNWLLPMVISSAMDYNSAQLNMKINSYNNEKKKVCR